MKSERKIWLLLVTTLLFLALTGCKSDKTDELQSKGKTATFAAYTDVEVYQDVPALVTDDSKIEKAEDYGDENYVINIQGTTLEDYRAYLETLKEAGFSQYCDNGEDGFEGNVYSATFTKDQITLSVTYVVAMEKVMVAASKDLKFSGNLIYKEEYVANNIPGAQTKIYFPELKGIIGFSAIIQLKNGHFIVHDGGYTADAAELVESLETLAPEGEKPIIDAWFISHCHEDHVRAVTEVGMNAKLNSKVTVESFYFYQPSDGYSMFEASYQDLETLWYVFSLFQNSEGEQTPVYRPQFGQRYYFCDLVIDVITTLEVLPFDSLACYDFNDTSVFLMHHIEGQKYLTTGDACHAIQRIAVTVYPKSYFDLDIYMVPHHAANQYNYFVDHSTIKTAITPRPDLYHPRNIEENQYLYDVVEEAYSRKDGMVILTFPYTVGTAEIVKSLK